jgi:hypothetical protein
MRRISRSTTAPRRPLFSLSRKRAKSDRSSPGAETLISLEWSRGCFQNVSVLAKPNLTQPDLPASRSPRILRFNEVGLGWISVSYDS